VLSPIQRTGTRRPCGLFKTQDHPAIDSKAPMNIEPFGIAIPEAAVADLHARLKRARLPDSIEDQGQREGIEPAFLHRILDRWANGFDWREQEARLNHLPQYLTRVDEHLIHFVHQPGRGPSPLPLVLTHGWPGSFLEMERIIPLLADPGTHGGDPADSFHVVVPSLPGYAFSPGPRHKGIGAHATARLWATLMTQLGYERFGAQGGDIGAGVSAWLGVLFPERVVGMHMNFIPGSYSPPLGHGQPAVTVEERAWQLRVAEWVDQEGAYSRLHATKPYTLAIGLNDSPAGLAAWIGEKFHAWAEDFESTIPIDTLLTNLSLYWFTQTIGSSMRMYVEGRAQPLVLQERVRPPLGVAVFPAEIPLPPRSWVERCFDVQRWTHMAAGGHFAALEQPELLAEEIRAFFRPLRLGMTSAAKGSE
jgi:pimeloyl-ACP methyl ester carboxylesterase